MRKIDDKLTVKKFMALYYLWPYSNHSLLASLALLKVPGTVRIIEGHALITAIKELKKSI
ncbi:MAG TPA: hypothetical protein DCQ45_03580 [Erysipelotrichaceae bacterium]|nr:hypothetical protein [Erysipelotrichaceae bacterium]